MKSRHSHRSPAIFAGLLLILLGGLLFLASMGIVSWDRWWQFFLIGLGVILLIDAFVDYRQDIYHGFKSGRVIAAVVLIVLGIVFLLSMVNWWALIIMAVGIIILAAGLWRRPSNS